MNNFYVFILALFAVTVLVAFLVNLTVKFLFLSYAHKRKSMHKMRTLQLRYEKEALAARVEIQQQTQFAIAQDMHDNVNLSLIIANMHLQLISWDNIDDAKTRVTDCIQTLSKSIADIKELSRSLSSDITGQSGLLAAIEEEIKQILRLKLFTIDYTVTGESVYLETQKELIIFRIIQECFNNSIRHSRCTNLSLALQYTAGSLHITVRDNGRGFPESNEKNKGGSGLNNMRSRIKSIGGSIHIADAPGKGVMIRLVIPISKKERNMDSAPPH